VLILEWNTKFCNIQVRVSDINALKCTEYGIGEGRGYTLIHFLSTDIDLSCILIKGGMRILRDAF
jgi:hypothetical protein